ncbi:MAG: hypothetical protein LIO77_03700 [Rikenellaceae bacterium]|nr:hypothetical protein [Rikenellaceae bacterium]
MWKRGKHQALIQIEFVNKTSPQDWVFRKDTLQLVSNGVDPQTGKESLEYIPYVNMIKDATQMKVDTNKYIEYIHFRFTARGLQDVPSRGIILYLCSLQAEDAGGAAYVMPFSSRHCIVFRSNLGKYSTYAHEIGHTLGLYHTFHNEDDSGNIITIDDDIRQKITAWQDNITQKENEKNGYLGAKSEYFDSYPDQKAEVEKFFDNYKARYHQYIQEYPISMNRDKLKFDKGKTDNIMDYTSNRTFFTKRQWEIMQQETLEYYNEN